MHTPALKCHVGRVLNVTQGPGLQLSPSSLSWYHCLPPSRSDSGQELEGRSLVLVSSSHSRLTFGRAVLPQVCCSAPTGSAVPRAACWGPGRALEDKDDPN